MSTSPGEAAELLIDSLRRKKKRKDVAGIAVVSAQLGQLKAVTGHTEEAIKYFKAAKDIAQKLDMRETVALSLHDLGTLVSSSGKPTLGLKYYRRAYRLAREDGYLQTQILIGASLGRLCFELQRFDNCVAAFRDVIRAAERAPDRVGLICGHHAIGVVLRLRGRIKTGSEHLQRALHLARKVQDNDWLARCVIDGCRRVTKGEFDGFDQHALRRAGMMERKRHNWAAAGRIWEVCADESSKAGASPTTTRHAFIAAAECFARISSYRVRQTDVLAKYYLWLWQNHECPQAIKVLQQADVVARAAHRPDLVARFLDQQGVCLQETHRYKEARSAHLRALRIARQHHDEEQITRSLNNLGEVLRKLGKHQAAIRVLEEAQRIAITRRDFDAAVDAAGNRSLVLWAQGNEQQVARVLGWCRRIAVQHGLWSGATLALARLAELAWSQGRNKRAKQLFRVALTEARKHLPKERGYRIALNYSRLLLSEGEGLVAARVWHERKDTFMQEPDAYLFHYTLGEIYHDTRDFASAETHWRLGRSSAEKAGDQEYVALCASRLAEVLEIRQQLSASERELRTALRNESEPMGRALLFIQLLRVQLAKRHSKAAEETFVVVRDIAAANRLHTVTSDIHVMMGDYYWAQSRGAKLDALKAYVVAMLAALEVGSESYGSIVAHFITFLTRPRRVPSEPRLAGLAKSLKQWAAKTITNDPRSLECVMWPIAIVKRLLPFTGDGQKLANELRRLGTSGELLPPLD